MTPIPRVNAFPTLQNPPSFVQMRWSIHRRGEPDPDLTYPAIHIIGSECVRNGKRKDSLFLLQACKTDDIAGKTGSV